MNLLETNIYDVKGKVLICGTCLPRMQKDEFKKLEKEFDTILYLCLEKEHINMAITKISGMLSTNKIESLTFGSVNKSPHCIQLHYIKHEIERVMEDIPKIENIIIEDNKIYKISDETISLSKNLVKLEKINN